MSGMKSYPIVLAHGIARFDAITDTLIRRLNTLVWDLNLESNRTHYFKGIDAHLTKHGYDVYTTNVGFADAVEDRAAQLAKQIRDILAKTGQEKVHIIGHSMGGLDSRQMLFQEPEMADMVASVTSIGTPHNGTSFAEVGLAVGGNAAIEAVSPYMSFEGFKTLTPAKRQAFNQAAEDWEAQNPVFYQVYAGAQDEDRLFTPLRKSWEIIFTREGANDGLVPVSSQLWQSQLAAKDGTTKSIRQHRFPFPVDHLNECGWWDIHEIHGSGWWNVKKWGEKRRFETAVKNVYLKIAKDVTTAVPPS